MVFEPRRAIKALVLANFFAESTTLVSEDEPHPWPLSLYIDGLSTKDRSGAGLIIDSPSGVRHEHALKFMFKASNNEAEYKALIA